MDGKLNRPAIALLLALLLCGCGEDHDTLIDPNGLENHPPTVPQLISPLNFATALQPDSTLFRWEGSDPDREDVLVYDVYLGLDSSAVLVAEALDTNCYQPSGLDYSATYFWKVIARDHAQEESESELRRFSTDQSTAEKLQGILPLAVGNTWSYEVEKISWSQEIYGPVVYDTVQFELTVTVDAVMDTSLMDDGYAYHISSDSTWSPFSAGWYGASEDQLYQFEEGEIGWHWRPLQQYPLPVGVVYWASESKFTIVDDEAEITLSDVTFDSCYISKYEESSWGMTNAWAGMTEWAFSPGVGIVKYTSSDSSWIPDRPSNGYGSTSVARLVSYQLTE